jgi:ubiquitin C-terminal hydrolase
MYKNRYLNDFSEILQIFYGTQVSELIRIENLNKNTSITPEPFFLLSLSIPPTENSTLYQCLDLFVEEEILEIENTSNKCIKKKISFWSLPDILAIDFKRFDSYNIKNNTVISFPEELDLSKYVIGYNPNIYKYLLYAICFHSGNTESGHYYCAIKNEQYNVWVIYNDTLVYPAKNVDEIINGEVYCLFYERRHQAP